MQECDVLAVGTTARHLVDETNAGGSAAFQSSCEVIDDEADVMDAWSALGDEFADG